MAASPAVRSGVDWTGCTEVEQLPGKVSGAPILRHSRLQADAVIDNYNSGASAAEISNWFSVPLQQVLAVLTFALPGETIRVGDERVAAQERVLGIDWIGCSEVEQVPGKARGDAPTLKHSTVAADVIVINHNFGIKPETIAAVFHVPLQQVSAVLDYAFPQVGKVHENLLRQ